MIVLAGLLIASYLASAAYSGLSGASGMSGVWWELPATALLQLGASFGPAVAGGESWRLLSAIFLHGGVLHLAFNTFALVEIGRPLEKQIGRLATLSIFLLTGACGFFASLLWHPNGISVGASGGIFGLLGAWTLLNVARPSPHGENLARRTPQLFLALFLALGVGFLVPNVDHAAHLGGVGTGLVLGLALRTEKWRWPIFFASDLCG